jgi:hypothetical protein
MTNPTPQPDPGATPPTGQPTPEPPRTDPPKPDDKPLGEAGQKALAEERAARKDLEKRLAALEPLGQLASALNVKPDQGKTDVQTLTDQIAQMQKDLTDERAGRLRAEVAAEKKLPPALAGRLHGSTREELAADADALLAAFPAASGAPAPDPTQGARGGAGELEALLKAAQEKGDTKTAIHLKTRIAAEKARK